MKKISIIVFGILAVCFSVVFLTGCTSNDLNVYSIVASYDDETKILSCDQTLTYYNDSNNALSYVKFNIYPNAYREGASNRLVTSAYLEKAYDNEVNYGEFIIKSVKVNDMTGTYEVCGEDENILKVDLPQELYPGETSKIEIGYSVTLANINHRLGYGANTINFGGFYPVACVYEDGKGFIEQVYQSSGDPFYSDVSNYYVTFSCSSDYVMASSGEFESVQTKNDITIYKIKAHKVRDFCFVLSKEFKEITTVEEGIQIKYYYFDDENAEAHLETSCNAISTYNELFGKYPYSQLSVVQTNFCFGGMEWPNLVMISSNVTGKDVDYVIAHEIAHQWWYGVVGDDELREAWLDESLTEYSTVLFFEANPDYDLAYETILQNATDTYKFFVKIFSSIYDDFDESMNRSLTEFATEPEYVNLVYTKGVLMFDAVRNIVGKKAFLNMLQTYYKTYMYENVTSDEFIALFCEKYDLASLFDNFLNGNVQVV